MNKFNIDVRQVDVPKVTADIDWSMLKDDQTTRDLIEHWQREQQYRQKAMMGIWDTPRMDSDDFLSRLNPTVMQDNPLAELLRYLLEKADTMNGPFSWFWGCDWGDYRRESLDKRFLARLEVDIRDRAYASSPFEREEVSRGNVSAIIRGHGDGDALTKSPAWRFSSRTREFLGLLKPLIRQMGRCEPDISINAEFRRYGLDSKFMQRSKNDIDILGISLSIGDLLVFCNFRDRDNFDVRCNHIGHSVFHLRDRSVKIKNAREALLICNKNETLFTFRWDERLRNMMAGETPSQEELMMMEMAGYKDEFWLDNIDGFDTLKIKPFNMMEQQRWYELTIPRFQF